MSYHRMGLRVGPVDYDAESIFWGGRAFQPRHSLGKSLRTLDALLKLNLSYILGMIRPIAEQWIVTTKIISALPLAPRLEDALCSAEDGESVGKIAGTIQGVVEEVKNHSERDLTAVTKHMKTNWKRLKAVVPNV